VQYGNPLELPQRTHGGIHIRFQLAEEHLGGLEGLLIVLFTF